MTSSEPVQGIYIVGNDRFYDEVRALVNSIRCFDTTASICLIPYDQEYQRIYDWLEQEHGALLYPDLQLLEEIQRTLEDWFHYPGAPAQRDKVGRLRNLACWFGPYDRFIYMDADIVAFSKVLSICGHLKDHDFIACDDMYRHGGKWVFTDRGRRLFPQRQLERIFNGGFWVSRKGLFSKRSLYRLLEEGRTKHVTGSRPHSICQTMPFRSLS